MGVTISLDASREARSTKVAAMARLLIDWRCWADVDDCKLVLRHGGFSHFEIEALLADARQIAVQHIIEMEISAS